MRMSGKYQICVGNGNLFRIIGSMCQQNDKIIRGQRECRRLAILFKIKRITYTGY